MRTKVFLKTVALSAVILFSAMAASAANKNNLIYNSEGWLGKPFTRWTVEL